MRVLTSALAFAALPALALTATIPTKRDNTIPDISGMSTVFSGTFEGDSGDGVDSSVWNIATSINTNSELQTYTTASRNLQLSGGSTVQLVPWKSASGAWTSGRIETKGSWYAKAGTKMLFSVKARMGGAPAADAQGMWPGIWMLGNSIRDGSNTGWPACGEIDIMEQVNGLPTAYATIHCTDAICQPDTSKGFQNSTSTDSDWHVWSVEIDRTVSPETMNFMKDGVVYGPTSETQFSASVWNTLAHEPMYFILNLAVGGTWPGDPDDSTLDGYENMLEVLYVAVYST